MGGAVHRDVLCVGCRARVAGQTELSRGTGYCGTCAVLRRDQALDTPEGREYLTGHRELLEGLIEAERDPDFPFEADYLEGDADDDAGDSHT